ncbi:MAG: cytochrome c-type biogenesis protein, partial [Endozoicomonas sp.]
WGFALLPPGSNLKSIGYRCLFVFSILLFLGSAHGTIDSYEFDTGEQEKQFFELNNMLRCPKCQNQTIGDSNAPIAHDLRREVHRMVVDGADNDTIINFMLVRYGDFVLYKPRWTRVNLILWIGPMLLLIIGFFIVFMVVRKHKVSVEGEQQTVYEEGLTVEQEQELEKRLKQFQINNDDQSSGEKQI